MEALDKYIPEPVREIDKPFLMPVEDVFSIKGRGTVGTGRIERGMVKVGDEVEIVGLGETRKTIVTGVEMFNKTLDQGQAGDNVGLPAARHREGRAGARQVLAKPGQHHPAQQVRGRGVRADQGGRRAAQPVLHRLPPAVLLPDHRRDRDDQAAGRGGDVHARRQHRDGGGTAEHPIAMEEGLRFAIREGGRTVGAGVVTKILE